MFIQTEATQDANIIKFFPGRTVLEDGKAEFPDSDAAGGSLLAQRLFGVDGIAAVTFDHDFVSVTKDGDLDWAALKPAVLGAIMDHFIAGLPVMEGDVPQPTEAAGNAEAATDQQAEETAPEPDARVVAEIKELIETRITPAVTQNGGSVAYHSMKGSTVYLEFGGSAYSMLQPIENMISHYVEQVEAVRDHRDSLPKPGLETPIGQAVAQVIQERVNPAVASHGGFITLVDVIDDNKAFIRLEGGCQGCGMASVTLKQGVEVEIKKAVPQIAEVLDVTDHAGGANPYYQPGNAAPM
jgi:Fe-S cluster biogenesis protein NfuA